MIEEEQSRLHIWEKKLRKGAEDHKEYVLASESFDDYVKLSSISSFPQKGEVIRDVVRTFPGHVFFHGNIGELMLSRILTAFALSRPVIGYCQVR